MTRNVSIAALSLAAALFALPGCGGDSSEFERTATSTTTGTGTNTGTQTGAAPSAVIVAPDKPQKVSMEVVYELLDAESDLCSVVIEYSTDDGQSWNLATEDTQVAGHEPTSNLSSSPLGARHAFGWDLAQDIGNENNLHVQLRVTPDDGTVGQEGQTQSFAVVNAGRTDPDCAFDTSLDVVVLSANRVGGNVRGSWRINRVVHTKVYGDGRVVYTDPAKGFFEIFQGYLSEDEIVVLLKQAADGGFWGFNPFYQAQSAPMDMTTSQIAIKLANGTEKVVGSYGGQMSAPPGFMDIYDGWHFPQLQPDNVVSYIRQPIQPWELTQKQYFGEEYEKRLETPLNWKWFMSGGPSGQPIWKEN